MTPTELSKDEATAICNALFQYVNYMSIEESETDWKLEAATYNKVAAANDLPSWEQRLKEKIDLFNQTGI